MISLIIAGPFSFFFLFPHLAKLIQKSPHKYLYLWKISSRILPTFPFDRGRIPHSSLRLSRVGGGFVLYIISGVRNEKKKKCDRQKKASVQKYTMSTSSKLFVFFINFFNLFYLFIYFFNFFNFYYYLFLSFIFLKKIFFHVLCLHATPLGYDISTYMNLAWTDAPYLYIHFRAVSPRNILRHLGISPPPLLGLTFL